jgi:hypothetical protein
MMSRLFIIFVGIAAISLCNCTHKISKEPPYALFSGRDVILNRPMALVLDKGSFNPFSPVELVNTGRDEFGRSRVGKLDAGTKIRIDSVYWVNAYDSAWVTAVGRTVQKPSHVFELYLGGYPHGKLEEVP